MIFTAALLALQTPATFDGVFFTGNDLYGECQAPDRARCIAYILGVTDSLQDAALRHPPRTFCLGGGVIARQLTDVVVQFLNEYPQMRHASAASIVAAALERAFPCRVRPVR